MYAVVDGRRCQVSVLDVGCGMLKEVASWMGKEWIVEEKRASKQ